SSRPYGLTSAAPDGNGRATLLSPDTLGDEVRAGTYRTTRNDGAAVCGAPTDRCVYHGCGTTSSAAVGATGGAMAPGCHTPRPSWRVGGASKQTSGSTVAAPFRPAIRVRAT